MIFSRTCTLMLMVSAVSLLAVGCESKVNQCNKLIKVANQASTELKSMNKGNNTNAVGQLKAAANSLDQYAKEMKAVELKDEKLKDFQDRFVKMYEQSRDSSRAIVAAVDKKDSKAANENLSKLQTAASQENTLVNDVNQYCQGK